MATDYSKLVQEFHSAFNLFQQQKPGAVTLDLCELRFRLLEEENREYLEASEAGDAVKIADALGDMLYVLWGTIVTHGMQDLIGPVFEEIHRSNMSKLDENGKPILREDGKVMKSERYFRPDIPKVMAELGMKISEE